MTTDTIIAQLPLPNHVVWGLGFLRCPPQDGLAAASLGFGDWSGSSISIFSFAFRMGVDSTCAGRTLPVMAEAAFDPHSVAPGDCYEPPDLCWDSCGNGSEPPGNRAERNFRRRFTGSYEQN